jgi:hypothetical protein
MCSLGTGNKHSTAISEPWKEKHVQIFFIFFLSCGSYCEQLLVSGLVADPVESGENHETHHQMGG